MRTIADQAELNIELSKDDVIYDEWIPFEHLSEMLQDIEVKSNAVNKMYRQRLYNAFRTNKVNYKVFGGIKCINIKEPMKAPASIKLNFTFKEV